jgi:hypothetical protein
MARFRGSDEALEREVAAIQGLVRVRLRRATEELRELDEALAELRRELRRRRVPAPGSVTAAASADSPA